MRAVHDNGNFMTTHPVVVETFQSKRQTPTSWWCKRKSQGLTTVIMDICTKFHGKRKEKIVEKRKNSHIHRQIYSTINLLVINQTIFLSQTKREEIVPENCWIVEYHKQNFIDFHCIVVKFQRWYWTHKTQTIYMVVYHKRKVSFCLLFGWLLPFQSKTASVPVIDLSLWQGLMGTRETADGQERDTNDTVWL